ncbi:hypothetical protein BDW02DRAFT_523371, partial [Decorospora gaudefroyi]
MQLPCELVCAHFTHLNSITGVVVVVRAGDKFVHVHKDVLSSTSEFLKNAMKPEWRTDESAAIDLSDEYTATVQAYCQWLYTRRLVKLTNNWLHLARLYVLGSKLKDKKFQRMVLDAMIEMASKRGGNPSFPVIKTIYDGTTKGSPARRLMV